MDFSPDGGMWLGMILSLMIFSVVFRENVLERLAQYVLVGAASGYLAILVIQDILRPKLVEPLVASSFLAVDLIVPLVLGIGLVSLGISATLRQGHMTALSKAAAAEPRPRQPLGFLYEIGRIALLIVLGVGIANAVTGSIQGTLLPQFWQATRVRAALDAAGGDWSAPLVLGMLAALVATIGTILHLYVVDRVVDRGPKPATTQGSNPDVKPSTSITTLAARFTRNPLLRGWAAIGRRLIWFAAGVLFARLAASRLSLLIAQITHWVEMLETTTGWQRLIQLLETLI